MENSNQTLHKKAAKNKKAYKDSTRELPLYTAVYKLLKLTDDIMVNMSKDHKHTFGQLLVNWELEMLKLLSTANFNPEARIETLQTILDLLANVELIIKLCSEKRYIDEKLYVQVIPLLASVGRQADGWLAKCQRECQGSCDEQEENIIIHKEGFILPPCPEKES